MQALTHSSYSINNYERLEFLGDSILDFVVGEYYFNIRTLSEQELTRIRSHKVSEENLSKVFDLLNIHDDIRLGKSMQNRITNSIKCDMMEAIIAAIYLTFGINYVKQFIIELLDLKTYSDLKDYKSMFQEYAQETKLNYCYETYKTDGDAHELTFFVKLIVNGSEISRASANKKSDAEKICAKIALNILKNNKN